ncbi:MAG TPA: YcgL domain-containing protein [Gammaproteobacteria bacterium]|nr:YcgL domain-containing protein [Gammaproteobacteria bacterium]
MSDESNGKKIRGAAPAPRRCWIYKGARRGDMYLYLAREGGFEAAPEALIEKMGKLELVMELELHPGRKLARADITEVMRSLESKGYYLQLPPARIPGRHRLQ